MENSRYLSRSNGGEHGQGRAWAAKSADPKRIDPASNVTPGCGPPKISTTTKSSPSIVTAAIEYRLIMPGILAILAKRNRRAAGYNCEMMPADVLVEVALAILAGMVAAHVIRWALPRRFTVRRLLILTAAVAAFIAAYKAWAPY